MLSDAKNNRHGLSIIAVISILVITISCLIYGSRLNKTLGEETNQYLSEIANQSVSVLKKLIMILMYILYQFIKIMRLKELYLLDQCQ
ncbi:hypothetical protein [Clostridioides sp. ZZV15-6383]|uniref:hypothetical protein n=1 Tax=unclassified Clostridioides TaxID=2635829 RepID=UPI001D105844